MENAEKLTWYGTQDDEKVNKNTPPYVVDTTIDNKKRTDHLCYADPIANIITWNAERKTT